MKYMLGFLATILSTITLAQLTQPPGGITGNAPPWAGGNGTTSQVLTSRGPTLAPTFQAAGGGGGTPGGSTTQLQYNNAGAFGGTSGLTWDGTNLTVGTANAIIATGTVGGGSAAAISSSSAAPAIGMRETDGGTDGKNYDFQVNANVFNIRAVNDANSAATVAFSFTRSNTSTAISNVTLGNATNNPSYTFAGTGATTLSGLINAGRAIISTGTKFTAAGTGCTVGTTTGGATAGTFTLAAGPCTSVALTMNGATGATAPNGWTCQAHDRTAPTVLIGGESSSTTTTATITIPAGAGATDVISFSCTGF